LNLPIVFGRRKQPAEPLEKFIVICIIPEDPSVLYSPDDSALSGLSLVKG
jgi:hypothetical protein